MESSAIKDITVGKIGSSATDDATFPSGTILSSVLDGLRDIIKGAYLLWIVAVHQSKTKQDQETEKRDFMAVIEDVIQRVDEEESTTEEQKQKFMKNIPSNY